MAVRLNWYRPHNRGKRTLLGRALGKLGPSWRASPWRRAIQTASLLIFLGLFLYVTWPYTAERAKSWYGWTPVAVDAETGAVALASEDGASDDLRAGRTIFAVDHGAGQEKPLGPFRIARVADGEVQLERVESPAESQRLELSMSIGPWTMHETDPGSWPSHYAEDLQAKQLLPAESFLSIDPLVGLSTSLASRAWVKSLAWGCLMLAIGLVIPRVFCGYLCPLGTLIDGADWLLWRRVSRLRVAGRGWWRNLRHYLLAGILVAGACGVLVSGFVAAIPVVTRALALLVKPLQTAAERGWHQVPPITGGQVLSIGLFVTILGLGILAPRFWCRYICPTGALFSLASFLRLTDRKVSESCVRCGKCAKACSFDAIGPDFEARIQDCTFCQTCAGVCPAESVGFSPRWVKATRAEPTNSRPSTVDAGRRSFLAGCIGVAAGSVGGIATAAMASPASRPAHAAIRPPGSVPEDLFARMCIRCGECLQACPNDVLQPSGLACGIDGLWTPRAVPDWSGCEPSCNNCGQVCPTGAIRALPLEEKRAARMGLAVVNERTCLPYAGQEACQWCVDECNTAGYHAIEFVRVGTRADAAGQPIPSSGMLAPVVRPDRCVGCGLCQTRCRAVNVLQKHRIGKSAIVIEAGPGKEDRLLEGSYVALREEEQRVREQQRRQMFEASGSSDNGYLPEFLNR